MLKTSHLLNVFILSATALLSASSFAGYVSVSVGGSAYLNSCGGTAEVNNGGNDDQVNLVFRGVTECSFYDDSNGKDQRLNLGRDKTTAFTITTANQNSVGAHTIRVYIHSKSNAHSETIDVSYRVNSSTQSYPVPRPTYNPRPSYPRAPSYAEVLAACSLYTTTLTTEAACNLVQSNPAITEGCYKNTSSRSDELLCIQGQIPAQVAKGCQNYTSTRANETLCLQLRVAPENARACKEYTTTVSQETACLQRAPRY